MSPSPALSELSQKIGSEMAKAGYRVGSIEFHIDSVDHNNKTANCHIAINYQDKGSGDGKPKNRTAKFSTYEDIFGASAGVRDAEGVPDDVLPKLFNLPAFARAAANTKRAPSEPQGDPAQREGSEGVAGNSEEDQSKDPLNKAIETSITATIDISSLKHYKKQNRRYIGGSSVGDPCDVYLSLAMRGYQSDTPRPGLIRIFREGHRIEQVVLEDLIGAGHKVEEVDPATGNQWRFMLNEHFLANLDGFITPSGSNERMTLEIKSMQNSEFSLFVRKGLRKSSPKYFAQVQAGLGMARSAGIKVRKGLLVAYAKSNSRYHTEVIDFDEEFYEEMLKRVKGIIHTGGIKHRDPKLKQANYQCDSCFKKGACWQKLLPEPEDRHCSLCIRAIPTDTGWHCTFKGVAVERDICADFNPFVNHIQ